MRTNTIHSVHLADSRHNRWDEDDLVARLSHALDLAESLIRQLDEQKDPDAFEREAFTCADGAEEGAAMLVADTSRLLLAASSVSSYSAIGPRILRVATLLLPYAHSQRVLRGICLEPATAFEQAIAHICLKRLDFYDCDFDTMLDLAAAAHAATGRERTPQQVLEQEWLRQGWLYPEGMRRLRGGPHIAASPLGRPIDLLYGSREDVTGFTRAVMAMTDFNLFPRPLPRSRDVLLAEAEAMLARSLDEQDYALSAEILLAWPLTGESWSPAAVFAFRVLSRAYPIAAITKTLDPEARHTVYAMGMLCAASLADQRMPPVRLPQTTVRAGAFDAVLDCIDMDERRSSWQEELDELASRECDPLAEFLLSIALHREIRRQDFAAAERLLAIGKALGFAGNPLALQAAEMMERLAQFADCLAGSDFQQEHDVSFCA